MRLIVYYIETDGTYGPEKHGAQEITIPDYPDAQMATQAMQDALYQLVGHSCFVITGTLRLEG